MKLYLKCGRIIQGKAAIECVQDIKANEMKLQKDVVIIDGTSGLGVFARSDIPKNEPLGIYPGNVSVFDNEEDIPFVGEFSFCIPYNDKLYSYDGTTPSIWSSDIIKYLNHCWCGKRRNVKHRLMKMEDDQNPVVVFFTERSIVSGQELRHNYGGAKDVKWMKTCCTSPRKRTTSQ